MFRDAESCVFVRILFTVMYSSLVLHGTVLVYFLDLHDTPMESASTVLGFLLLQLQVRTEGEGSHCIGHGRVLWKRSKLVMRVMNMKCHDPHPGFNRW